MRSIIYGDTLTHIDVAEVVDWEVRWWDFVCVSTRERIQFPSVLLQRGRLSPETSPACSRTATCFFMGFEIVGVLPESFTPGYLSAAAIDLYVPYPSPPEYTYRSGGVARGLTRAI